RNAPRAALARGRGSVLMRAKVHFEELRRDREAIIVTEIPYQVNKARMLERMVELVRDKRVEGISELRDESDRHGMRVVIELKRDASAQVVLNQLYRYSELQTSFGVNMLALIADPRHLVMADNTIRLTEEQAKAILELRLQRLTALGIAEIAEEVQKLGIAIADYLDILRSRPRVLAIVKDELAVVRKEFAT